MRKGTDVQIELVEKGSPFYPAALLKEPWVSSTPELWALGNLAILRKPLLGFLCSVRCPGDVILRTYDAARALRDGGIPVIGGFHSPMEKECLAMLLKGTQPVVICPARSIQNMRIPALWHEPLDDGRLLVLSVFPSRQKRMTAELAARRNQFVGVLASVLLVPYAAPGGITEKLALGLRADAKQSRTITDCEKLLHEIKSTKRYDLSALARTWAKGLRSH